MINLIQNSKDVQNLQGGIEENAYTNQNSTQIFFNFKTKLQGIIENFANNCDKTIDEQINDKFLKLDFADEFNINIDKIGVNDAMFFMNLIYQQNNINYSFEDNKISFEVNNKNVQISNSLLNIIQTSIATNKPVRLDFDNNITVILKMDKNGKVQTHFLPGSSEIEAYLKQNLPALKQTFDNQNINYSTISYSKYKENNSKKEKRSKK